MKTDELIAMLANSMDAIEPHALRRRYTLALAWGACGTALLMAIMLGVRPDLAEVARLPMFWVRLAFLAALLAGALLATIRLSHPGMALRGALVAIVVPLLTLWLLAAITLLDAVPGEREKLIFGDTWMYCPLYVAILSVPLLGALLWAMKGCAPTRLTLAGAAAGLLAGTGGALVFVLYCTEMAAPFIGIWYVLGILIPTAIGAMLGPRLLRW